MANLFGYTPSEIETQYKQDLYLEEAREYRLIHQINLENKKKKPQNSPRRSIRVFNRFRVSDGQALEDVLFLGRVNRS